MWVVPFVGGQGQCPAVNIAMAQKLELRRVQGSNSGDRMAVVACFGPDTKERENEIPLMEYIIWDMSTNPPTDKGYEYGTYFLSKILDALRSGNVFVFDAEKAMT